MDIIESLKKLDCGNVIKNVNLKDYTTYGLEGTGLGIIFPNSVEDLKKVLSFLKKHNMKHKIIGNGSNLIFNEYYDGILIKLDSFNDLKIEGNSIFVGAGYSLMKLALKVSRMGLTGLEFATGIPGSVGGAIFMNAGAYKSDMGYVTQNVTVLTPSLEIKTMSNKEMDFHYRSSFIQKNPGYVCLSAEIKLQYGNRDAIMEVIKDRKKRRLESQPLEYPSAGSVFRNPTDNFAGKLIEEIGYKGKNIGGAEVSMKHANFIINKNKATGENIKKIILEIQKKVKEKFGIELIVEQEFVE